MDLKAFEKALEQMHRGRLKQARGAFEKLAAKTDNPSFRERCRSYADACKLRERTEVSKPDSMTRAVALMNIGAFDDSEALLLSMSKDRPKDDVVWFTLACLYARKGSDSEAMTALQQAIELNPANRVHAVNHPDFHALKDRICSM